MERWKIRENMKNKNFSIVCGYMLFYLVSFFILERQPVRQVIIHCAWDEKIPFCEYFIIPYVIWFFFVAGTVLYFWLFNESSGEYARLVGSLATGMTIFLIVSFVCPNRHMLRPNLTGDGILIEAVRLLYWIDTPTNIFPSIHVFNTMACYLALRKNKRCRENRAAMLGIGVISVSIILSTMFLKQHTVLDVIGALGLNWVCYGVFYKWMPQNRTLFLCLLNRKELFSTANLLNLLRMGTAILFWGLSQRLDLLIRQAWLAGILVLSIVIDYGNGRLERKKVSVGTVEWFLDLAADRVTQGVVFLHLISRYRKLEVLFLIFMAKELIVAFTGIRSAMEREKEFRYVRFHDAVFNAVLVILMLCSGITKQTANLLIAISEVLMTGTLLICFRYSREFAGEKGEEREQC